MNDTSPIRQSHGIEKPCDDAEIMRLWRECGLPGWFLGNGGTNHKLVEFAERIVIAERYRRLPRRCQS